MRRLLGRSSNKDGWLKQALLYGGKSSRYLWDEFTTDASVPMTSPRNCEPGPGQLTITDASNILSVASGKLQATGATALAGVVSAALTRRPGLALFGICDGTFSSGVGWHTSATLQNAYTSLLYGFSAIGRARIIANGAVLSVGLASTVNMALVLRSAGAYYFEKVGAAWNLIWVSDRATTSPLYAQWGNANNTALNWCDWLRVVQLMHPFTSQFGLAKDYKLTPASGNTLNASAEHFTSVVWTPAANDVLDLQFRIQDASNYWLVRCDQAGSTIKLYEVNAGTLTERATAAYTWTVGTAFTVIAMARANAMMAAVSDTSKVSYSSASFQTNTGAKVELTGTGSLANFATFDTTVTNVAVLRELNKG
jgi:hypothetical protein